MWMKGLTTRQVRAVIVAVSKLPNVKSMTRAEYNDALAKMRVELYGEVN